MEVNEYDILLSNILKNLWVDLDCIVLYLIFVWVVRLFVDVIGVIRCFMVRKVVRLVVYVEIMIRIKNYYIVLIICFDRDLENV